MFRLPAYIPLTAPDIFQKGESNNCLSKDLYPPSYMSEHKAHLPSFEPPLRTPEKSPAPVRQAIPGPHHKSVHSSLSRPDNRVRSKKSLPSRYKVNCPQL